jgi:3-oxoacyl-[acyl-carrier-protein] synthase-1
MVQPSGEGALRCMKQALEGVKSRWITSIPTAPALPPAIFANWKRFREVFGDRIPPISSTKSLTGHALGAAGVHEAIYSLLMMDNRFIAASANIETLDPAAEGLPIVRQRVDNADLKVVMSNSFGFGGTNATLVFRRLVMRQMANMTFFLIMLMTASDVIAGFTVTISSSRRDWQRE